MAKNKKISKKRVQQLVVKEEAQRRRLEEL
jgi:hypothetical protein